MAVCSDDVGIVQLLKIVVSGGDWDKYMQKSFVYFQ